MEIEEPPIGSGAGHKVNNDPAPVIVPEAARVWLATGLVAEDQEASEVIGRAVAAQLIDRAVAQLIVLAVAQPIVRVAEQMRGPAAAAPEDPAPCPRTAAAGTELVTVP